MKGKPNNRGVAQLASASGLGPEGPVFESQYPDLQKQLSEIQMVAFFFYPPFPFNPEIHSLFRTTLCISPSHP